MAPTRTRSDAAAGSGTLGPADCRGEPLSSDPAVPPRHREAVPPALRRDRGPAEGPAVDGFGFDAVSEGVAQQQARFGNAEIARAVASGEGLDGGALPVGPMGNAATAAAYERARRGPETSPGEGTATPAAAAPPTVQGEEGADPAAGDAALDEEAPLPAVAAQREGAGPQADAEAATGAPASAVPADAQAAEPPVEAQAGSPAEQAPVAAEPAVAEAAAASAPDGPAPPAAGPTAAAPVQAAPARPQAVTGRVDPAHDTFLADLWAARTGARPEEQAAAQAATFATLGTEVAATQQRVLDHGASGADQARQLGLDRAARLEGTLPGLTGQLDAALAQAAAQIQAATAAATEAVAAGAARARAGVDQAEVEGTAAVGERFAQAHEQLAARAEAAASELVSTFDSRLGALGQVGETYAQRALAQGEAAARGYAGGADDLAQRKNEARRQAARDVARQNADDARQIATNLAQEQAAARDALPGLVDQVAAQVGAELSTHETRATQAVADTAAAARSQVDTAEQDALAHLSRSEADTLAQLDTQGTAAKAHVAEAGAGVASQLTAASEQGGAELDRQAARLSERFAAEYERLAEVVSSGPLAEDDRFLEMIQAARAALAQREEQVFGMLDETLVALTETLDTHGAEAFQQLTERTGSLVDRLAELAMGHGEAAAEAGAGFDATMTDLVQQTRDGVAELATRIGTELSASLTAAGGGFDRIGERIAAELGDARSAISATLDEHLSRLAPAIRTEAEKAADQVKPAWRRVLAAVVSVVVSVVVFVAMSAVVLATLPASLPTLAALVVAGAVAGAASGFASSVIKDMVLGDDVDWGNAGVSALLGGIGGAIGGAFAGRWAASMNGWAKAGLENFSTAFVEQLFDMGLQGEAFNLMELLVSGTFGSLMARGMGRAAEVGQWPQQVGRRLFGGRNAWNSFQRQLSDVVTVSDPAVRARIYQIITEGPQKSVEGLIKEISNEFGVTGDPDKGDGLYADPA